MLENSVSSSPFCANPFLILSVFYKKNNPMLKLCSGTDLRAWNHVFFIQQLSVGQEELCLNCNTHLNEKPYNAWTQHKPWVLQECKDQNALVMKFSLSVTYNCCCGDFSATSSSFSLSVLVLRLACCRCMFYHQRLLMKDRYREFWSHECCWVQAHQSHCHCPCYSHCGLGPSGIWVPWGMLSMSLCHLWESALSASSS